MGIDPVRGTSDKGAVVLAFFNRKSVHLLWEDGVNVVNDIMERFAQDGNEKLISYLQLIQMGEQFRRGKPPVTGEDRMGAWAADGERRALKVSNSYLQDGGVNAVIDGKFYINLWNLECQRKPCRLR